MRKLNWLCLFVFAIGATSCDNDESGGGNYNGGADADTPDSDDMGVPEPGAATVQDTIAGWGTVPQEVANLMISQYGQPDEWTESHLIWHDNGVWKHTTVYRDEIQHDFPTPHTDLLEQAIDYAVEPDRFDDLAHYDGSVIVERTKGEISARCDKEGANFLALNLAHEVATGMTTWEEARVMYGEQVLAALAGEPAPYMDGFLFDLPTEATADPDMATITVTE